VWPEILTPVAEPLPGGDAVRGAFSFIQLGQFFPVH
jgi:hypothetical protein